MKIKNNDTVWDAFISHASEDKVGVVEPLAEELRKRNIKVWYDKWVLKIGDRLLDNIDNGLVKSRYGIVVLSPDFLRKEWPKNELEGLMQKEIDGKKVILPVWHNIGRTSLLAYSPVLAGRMAGTTKNGIKSLSGELINAMEDIPGPSENEIVKSSVDVNISFKNKSITSDLHKYSMLFGITLNAPPAKSNFLVRLYWPSFIRITLQNNFSESLSVKRNGKDYIKLSYRSDQRLYPGDSVEIVSPQGRTELEYEFDYDIWDKVDSGQYELIWEVYFEDQMPIKGSLNFLKLNIF